MNKTHHPVFINLINTSDEYSDLNEGLSFHCQNTADYTVMETRENPLVPLHQRSGLVDAVRQARRQHDDPTIFVRAGHPVLFLQATNQQDIIDSWKWMRSNRINLEALALVPVFHRWDRLDDGFQKKAFSLAAQELGWQHRLPHEADKTIGRSHPAIRKLLGRMESDIADLFGGPFGKDAGFRRFASIARAYGLCGDLEHVASRKNRSLGVRPEECSGSAGAYRVVSVSGSENRARLNWLCLMA